MNTPLFDNEVTANENFELYCHHKEMENFSVYLYLEYKGTRTGYIGGNDPCEDFVLAISPKIFNILMISMHELVFTPVPSTKQTGVVLCLKTSFGLMYVYSRQKEGWSNPTSGSQHLGFTFTFSEHDKSFSPYVLSKYPIFEAAQGNKNEALSLTMRFSVGEETYLYDVHSAVMNWLSQLKRINSELKDMTLNAVSIN